MHVRQISYFLAVVEHGGFGRAAGALGVAQPTLSQSVKSLERELGAELFHRASPGVVLSAAGRALLGPARQLLRDVALARESVGGRRSEAAVDLVAAAPLGVHPGAALVGSFCQQNPGVAVRLDKPAADGNLPNMVGDGSSELGLTYLPVPRLGLTEVELGHHLLVLAFPPDAAPGPGPVSMSQLAGLALVGSPRWSWPRDLVEAQLRAAGVRTRLVMELGQRDTIVELVLAGVGAAFLMDAAAPAAAAKGVQIRSLEPPLRLGYGLVHRPLPLSSAARAFVAHAERFATALRAEPVG